MKSESYNLAAYSVHIEIPVAWGEMDAFAHVNNVQYFRYFESVRIAYFLRIGLGTTLETNTIGPILAETSCRYRFPFTFPDTVKAAARTRAYTDTELHMEYMVWSDTQANAAAVGTGRVVCFDFEQGVRRRFPDEILHAVRKLDPQCTKES